MVRREGGGGDRGSDQLTGGANLDRDARAATRERVHMAASAGGHLDLLTSLASQIVDPDAVVWVTSRTARGEAFARERDRVVMLPAYGRSVRRRIVNALASVKLALRERPRTVVTSGAGDVVTFCALARLLGARLVFIETMARVTQPSLTARLLSRIASKVVVQWPELARALAGADVCRPTLLEHVCEAPPAPGHGTFVAVGTHGQPHDRLLRIVGDAVERGVLPRPVFAQIGPASWSGRGVETVDWLTRDEMDRRLADAQVIVCHAGAGIISSALRAGRRPLVVPRDAARGEHVDDHQRQLAAKLAEWGLIVSLDEHLTARDVEAALSPLRTPAELADAPSAADVLRPALQVPRPPRRGTRVAV
jgi:UDP-N-acetylglucosamine--N-acetylmuramyl-(pentapeptide) pyrophosphoryl-undecaprenol N-acetylglucosamine transferase